MLPDAASPDVARCCQMLPNVARCSQSHDSKISCQSKKKLPPSLVMDISKRRPLTNDESMVHLASSKRKFQAKVSIGGQRTFNTKFQNQRSVGVAVV